MASPKAGDGFAIVTLTSCPVVAIPAGFTASGLPVGLQLIGRPRGEAALLGAAALFEQATGLDRRVPLDPRPEARVSA